jgi:hypothetical protein
MAIKRISLYYFPSKMLGAKSPTYLLLSSYRSCFDSGDRYFIVHNVEYLTEQMMRAGGEKPSRLSNLVEKRGLFV